MCNSKLADYGITSCKTDCHPKLYVCFSNIRLEDYDDKCNFAEDKIVTIMTALTYTTKEEKIQARKKMLEAKKELMAKMKEKLQSAQW